MIKWTIILLAPILGGILQGAMRILRARMQNRIGPPLLQPFYDMVKFFRKEGLMVNRLHIVFGIAHLLTLWIVVGYIVMGGNLLYAVFLHLLSAIFIILAGFSVRSVYSHIGANRELLSMLAYEPILILMAVAFYLQNGSYEIAFIRERDSQIVSLIAIFIAYLVIIPVKLKLSPFDASEAHQEIVGGVEVEYSGLFYEIIYTAKWLEYIFVYLLLMLFAGNSFLMALTLFVVVFVGSNVVDNATARIKISDMIKITTVLALGLALANIIKLSLV